MFHITIAIGRFFEILLYDIAKSIAGLIALAVVVVIAGIAALAGWRKLRRRFME